MIQIKILCTLVLCLCVNGAFADYAKENMNEQMAKAMKLTVPNENHALFKDMVGKWKTDSKFWMEANAKPEESKGTQTSKLIMEGRFLQSEFKGTAMGKPFTGMGLLGYDSVRQEYQSVWLDSMNTAMMVSNGTYETATKTLKESGTGSCPMTGDKNKAYRGEWRFLDKSHYTYSLFTHGTDGKEFKTMEITFTKG